MKMFEIKEPTKEKHTCQNRHTKKKKKKKKKKTHMPKYTANNDEKSSQLEQRQELQKAQQDEPWRR